SLLKFYNTYYSSSIMKLSVIGYESLDKLQEYVISMFSDIKNLNNFKSPIYDNNVNNIFDLKSFPKVFKIYPVKEARCILISWPLPTYYQLYKERPISLLSFCLGDEGEGSIL